jgi:ADP-heptose:LPS heptosyltransferase
LKTASQIRIDTFIIRPLALVVNVFVRIAGKLLSIDHRLDRDFKSIAICKFKGLGSIVQATPMISAFRKAYPQAEIIFVSTSSNQALLQELKDIDTIYTLDDSSLIRLISSYVGLQWRLLKKRPEVFIDLEIYSNFSTLVGVFALSKNRIGFYLRSSSFKMGIYTHMMFYNSTLPIAAVYFQVFRLFKPDEKMPGLFRFDEQVNDEQLDIQLIGPYIVINPNASDLRIERRWPASFFRAFIEQVQVNHPTIQLVLIGSKSESSYVTEIATGFNTQRVINLAGKTSMRGLINLIKHSNCVVTNDTGPMHLAFASKKPTICLFGPCSPEQYGQVENTKIHYKNMYCSPCVHEFSTPPCKGNNSCMQAITVAEVLQSFHEFMATGTFSTHEVNPPRFAFGDHILGQVNRN